MWVLDFAIVNYYLFSDRINKKKLYNIKNAHVGAWFERRRYSLALQFFPNLSWWCLVQSSHSGYVGINVVVQTSCFYPIFIHLNICFC